MGRLRTHRTHRTPPLVSLSLLLAARFLFPQLPSFVAPRAGQQPTATATAASGTAVLSKTLQLPGEAHAVPEQRILDFFNVTLDKGLSEHQVQQQLDEYGANQLLEPEKKSLWELVAEQFDDLLVKILLLSALVSFLLAYFNTDQKEEGLSAYIEPLVILMILVLNACVGVWQESNAEKAWVIVHCSWRWPMSADTCRSSQPCHNHVTLKCLKDDICSLATNVTSTIVKGPPSIFFLRGGVCFAIVNRKSQLFPKASVRFWQIQCNHNYN